MKRFFQFFLLLNCIFLTTVFAQKNDGFAKTESGIEYKIFKQGGTIKPKVGDLINAIIVYATMKDSIIYDSRQKTNLNIFELTTPAYKGAPEEGMQLMSKGDSAVFLFKADSLFAKTFKAPLPPYIKKGSKIKFFFRLLDIKSGEEKERYLAQLTEDKKKEMELLKELEQKDLEKFVELNNISAKPTASGLFYIEREAGNGAAIKVGEKVNVVYTCTLLDGNLVDNQMEKPVELPLGENKIHPGLEEGILMMKKGTKATLIIPSKLAFGEKSISNIKPYSTLIYDIEIKE